MGNVILTYHDKETGTMEEIPMSETDMVCEVHPWEEWPHDDCPGPGMPPDPSRADKPTSEAE